MKAIILLFFIIFLSGCVSNSYSDFYESYTDASTHSGLIVLKDGQIPIVHNTNDILRDLKIFNAKNYIAIGGVSFNGEFKKGYIEQAIKVGATDILIQVKYTNTLSSSTTILVPTSSTTTTTGVGTVGSTNVIYNGTTTTTGLGSIPVSTHQRRYDQAALFLVKTNRKFKFGISNAELTPEIKRKLGRNTGTLVDFVFEDSPAFYADIVSGDVITHIDGVKVLNTNHGVELMRNIDTKAEVSVLTIIRGTENKKIIVNFNKT